MNIETLGRMRRTANIAYSNHPVARLYRGWRYFIDDTEYELGGGRVNVLLLPLVMLALTVLLIATVPGVSDAIAATCEPLCMP